MIGIVLNLLLAVLLVGAAGVGLRLAAQLKAMRAGQKDFIKAVGDLDAAALRAQSALATLKTAGEEASDRLARQIAQASSLTERLERGLARAPGTSTTSDEADGSAHQVLARAKAAAILPRDSVSASSPRLETRRSRARVDDDLFEPQPGSPLRAIPGGRRE